MDEIHAVLELFVSCRGSSWPLVRVEAEQQLLTQHLLMAAPMDREEVEDLIGKCFEADRNGEINFLSFWAGMEKLLEHLGLREPSTFVDDKVYGLQRFRDGLLAEAVNKQQGPTSSVLLTRDEVLDIISQTSRAVSTRPGREDGDSSSSSLFWDEVYKETALLESSSVLSITELSMMVFGFLKSYVQEVAAGLHSSRRGSQDYEKTEAPHEAEQAVRRTTSGGSSIVSESDYAPEVAPQAVSESRVARGQLEDSYRSRGGREAAEEPCKEPEPLGSNRVMTPSEQWEASGDQTYRPELPQQGPERSSSLPSALSGSGLRQQESSSDRFSEADFATSHADAAAFMKAVAADAEDPSAQLRRLLLFAGKLTDGPLSRKDVQHLRYLNAAAIDCVDRMSAEREKRNEEMSDAVLSLTRMRTEKQHLIDQLAGLEHQHSQLQLQQEQQGYDKERLDQLEATLTSERLGRDRAQRLLREKDEELQRVTQEKEELLEKLAAQGEDCTRRLAVARQEHVAMTEDYRREIELLTREKESLEENLRSAEEAAKTAEAARQQLQSEAHLSASSLRQRVVELEEDKRRHEAEAEENDALILQLQGRLEEKVQQVTILEVKNKQQFRLLQQLRGVRNSLMQLLQEPQEKDAGDHASANPSREAVHQNHELAKLRAGMKAAQAQIKDLENFIDEMRKEQRRAAHPRYEFSGDSPGPSSHRQHVVQHSNAPLRALPTLGAELEMMGSSPYSGTARESCASCVSKASEVAAYEPRAVHGDTTVEPAGEEPKPEAGGLRQQIDSAATDSSQREEESGVSKASSSAVGEEAPGGAKQSTDITRLSKPEPNDAWPRRESNGEEKAEAPRSFVSLRSEASTTEAASKDPTSSASLPETEDIFDPLDLLNFEESPESGKLSNLLIKRRSSRSSRPLEVTVSRNATSGSAAKGGSVNSSTAAPVSLEASGLVSSPKFSTSHGTSPGGLELSLESKRRLARRTSGTSNVEQRPASAASSSLLSLPDLESQDTRHSSRERHALSDSYGSAASDGSFLMLSTAGDTVKSPGGSSRKGAGERHSRHEVMKPLDKTTLSGMFSMLGACAAISVNPRDRAVRSENMPESPSRKARNHEEQQGYEGKSSPKSKGKPPSRLPAALVAAMSSRDSSDFRSLRRATQERGQHGEKAEREAAEMSSPLSKAGGAAAGHVDAAALYSRESSRQSSAAEPRPSPKREETHSEKALPRARRTISLGLTESHVKNEPSSSPVPRLPAVQSVPASAKAPLSSGGNPAFTSHSQTDELTAPQGAAWNKGQVSMSSLSSEPESATTSHRKKAEGLSGKTASEEACRSGGDLNTKRSPRSRSSSAESPLRKEVSLRRAAPGRRSEEASKPSEGGEAQGAGDRRQAPSSSNLSHSAEGEGNSGGPPEHRQAGNPCDLVVSKELRGDERGPEAATEKHLRDKADLGSFSASSARLRDEEQARPTQQVQQVLGEGRLKIQDQETASAAALLAAAAGVVDASLHQQQQMIQRQQEHHEDLQRAQQRRIDMLQEQLEVLQKSKERQRESDELQQKQMIETLQAKLEELQRRQEQREQDFEEAQRKLLQQELEVQLKQRFEELGCSSGRPGFELQTGFPALRSHRLEAGPRVRQLSDEGYSLTNSGPASATDYNPGEEALHAAALSTEDWRRDLNGHPPCAAIPGRPASESHVRVSQLLASRPPDGRGPDDSRCLYSGEQPNGAVYRGDLRNSIADSQYQRLTNLPERVACEPVHQESESDDASSCASSSIMGSQGCFAGPGLAVEDVPTTSSSSFVSQAVTPGVCSSLPSHRAGHFSSEGKLERQVYARGGDLLAQQTTAVLDSGVRRRFIQHSQPSDSLPSSHQHVPAQRDREDPLRSAWVVQRTNSSTGSLWSPKASKRQAAGLWGRDALGTSASGTPTHRELLRNTSTKTPATGPQEALHQNDFLYSSGSLRHPPDPGRQPRQKGTSGGGLPASACHPVSRAERVVPVPLAPVDSARFLGNSASEKAVSGTEASGSRQSKHVIREPQLDAPPLSARSSASTSHWIASGHRTSLVPLAGFSQQLRNDDECLPASADFLGVTSVRSTMSRKLPVSRTSQALGRKQSGLSRSSETQIPFSPGRPRSHAGSTVSARSLAATTGRDSLIQGPRRTVSSLMSKLPRSNASEFSSPRQREVSDLSLADRDVSLRDPHDTLNGERFSSGKAAVTHRQARTRDALPDVVLRSAPHRRSKVRQGSSRTERSEGKSQPNDGEKPGEAAVADSNKPVQLSMDWAGFNTGFMSQVQKWIS